MASDKIAFIELIRNNPAIWDTSNEEYHDKASKRTAWENVILVYWPHYLELPENAQNEIAETVKKKWKNIRDSYSKYLKSEKFRKESPPKLLGRYKAWPWAQNMEFCRPYISQPSDQDHSEAQSRDPESALGVQEESEFSIENTFSFGGIEEDRLLQNVESMISVPEIKYAETLMLPPEDNRSSTLTDNNASARKRPYEEAFRQPASSSVDKILSYLEKRHPVPLLNFDEIDLIFLGYAKTVKRFSPRQQTMVKFQIAQMMMEEELKQLAENEKRADPEDAAATTTTTSTGNLAHSDTAEDSTLNSNTEESVAYPNAEESFIDGNLEEAIMDLKPNESILS